MKASESFLRSRLIIKRLMQGAASFEQIQTYLEQNCKLEKQLMISKRTFQRDIKDINNTLEIEIKYQAADKVYKIINKDWDSFSDRLLEAFDVFQLLHQKESFADYVIFEKRQPAGTDNLAIIIEAIKEQKLLCFQYQKFWEGESAEKMVHPYALKESQHRWYLIAYDPADGYLKTFGLDRMRLVYKEEKTFKHKPDFSVGEMFQYSYGVITKEGIPTEKIVLSFDPDQGMYIKTLPLHESQVVIIDDEEECRIELNLHATYDLEQKILSFGNRVQVISPQSLIDAIKQQLKETLAFYQ